MSIFSLNNRLIVEPYAKEGLRTEVKGAFAMLSQKIKSKGLKLLVDAKLNDGTVLPKGSLAYIREEVLHNGQWATKILESDAIEGNFIIIDLAHVDYVTTPTFNITVGQDLADTPL